MTFTDHGATVTIRRSPHETTIRGPHARDILGRRLRLALRRQGLQVWPYACAGNEAMLCARTADRSLMIFDGAWQVRDIVRAYNAGEAVTLLTQRVSPGGDTLSTK